MASKNRRRSNDLNAPSGAQTTERSMRGEKPAPCFKCGGDEFYCWTCGEREPFCGCDEESERNIGECDECLGGAREEEK